MPLFGLSEVDVDKMKAKGNLNGLIKALDYKKDRGVRCKAASALGDIGDTRAVGALVNALKDQDTYLRKHVTDALGRIRGDRAVDGLLVALKDQDSGVRVAAADALGLIGGNRVVDSLLIALKDENNAVEAHTVKALGKIGDPRALEQLTIKLKYSACAEVRSTAAKALEEMGYPPNQPLTPNLTLNDSIIMPKSDETNAEPMPQETMSLLKSNKADERYSAVDKLVAIGGMKANELLASMMLTDEDKFVRQHALCSLAKVRGQEVSDLIIKVLRDDPERRVRVSAVIYLGKWKCIDALLEALYDSGHTVRETAIEYLGEAGVLDQVARMLTDREGEVRQVAAETLGRHGNENAIPELRRLLADEDHYAREAAKRAIESIQKRIESRAETPTKDDNDRKREEAEQTIETKTSLDKNNNRVPRQTVAPKASQSEKDSLIRQLWNGNHDERLQAAKELGEKGDMSAIEPLMMAKADYPSNDFSTAVEKAIERIKLENSINEQIDVDNSLITEDEKVANAETIAKEESERKKAEEDYAQEIQALRAKNQLRNVYSTKQTKKSEKPGLQPYLKEFVPLRNTSHENYVNETETHQNNKPQTLKACSFCRNSYDEQQMHRLHTSESYFLCDECWNKRDSGNNSGYGCPFYNQDSLCVPPDEASVSRCSWRGNDFMSCAVYKVITARVQGGSTGSREAINDLFRNFGKY